MFITPAHFSGKGNLLIQVQVQDPAYFRTNCGCVEVNFTWQGNTQPWPREEHNVIDWNGTSIYFSLLNKVGGGINMCEVRIRFVSAGLRWCSRPQERQTKGGAALSTLSWLLKYTSRAQTWKEAFGIQTVSWVYSLGILKICSNCTSYIVGEWWNLLGRKKQRKLKKTWKSEKPDELPSTRENFYFPQASLLD